MNNKQLICLLIVFTTSVLFSSCANQLPPSGGDDDRTPPKIISISPRPNTVNFKGTKISFRFDEYVDRRSFEESFFISPKPKGEMTFDWSGTEVEVEFSKPLEKNKTYVVIIGKDLRDLRGSNPVNTPFSFAFATGPKIDEGNISGIVFSENNDRIKIFAYLIAGKSEDKLNPEKIAPDYVLQVTSGGDFGFTNLPDGDYRLFAVSDEDRNNLFDKDFDKIGILHDDIKLYKDSNSVTGIYFLMKDFEVNKNARNFLNLLKPDSIDYIYSNITNGNEDITPEYKFYFYFSKNNIPKSSIVNNFSLRDSAAGKSYKLVYNWLNDSLLEVFSTEKFSLSANISIVINLSETERKYVYERKFSIAGAGRFGMVSGKIISADGILSPVYIKLYIKDNAFVSFSARFTDTADFSFSEVLEGEYILFSFIDEDNDGKPGKGSHYPFIPAEKFMIYDKELKVKGGWNVENVFVKF